MAEKRTASRTSSASGSLAAPLSGLYCRGAVVTSWLRCLAPRPNAAVRLICFPHAGGSASSFHRWPQALADGIELHAVQYPGRADRFHEPLEQDALAVTRAVAAELAAVAGSGIALFGHSMGALLAYEVARLLPGVRHLFVSGALPTHLVHEQPTLWHPDDDVLVASLRKLGGPGLSALDDPHLRPQVLAYVRNDLRLVSDYRAPAGPPVRCPATVLVGDSDQLVPVPRVRRWTELVEGRCRVRIFPGGHFYLEDEYRAVTAEIARELLGAGPAG